MYPFRNQAKKTEGSTVPKKTTESKTAAKKVTKQTKKTDKKAAPAHPKFIDMITESLGKLNEKSGSSKQAILKYIVANFPVDEKTANQYLKVSLKNGVKSGAIKQVKGTGATGSFKLAKKASKTAPKKNSEKVAKPVKTNETTTKKQTVSKTKPLPKARKSVTKETVKTELPPATPKGRKPPAAREEAEPPKKRGRKSVAKPTEPVTPAPSPVEAPSKTSLKEEQVKEEAPQEQKKTPVSKGRKGKVTTKQAAEAKLKKTPAPSTRSKRNLQA
ncbi:unnamed protein product [Brachionus calyciflorus]|uniref:H15 domain-containing protein n=1 Tax=Brachionus calyciflorus TaxID=104777 RepID=A0A813ME97_9BILA|nr:unnamed protein product [Brachionus calyciflorus]